MTILAGWMPIDGRPGGSVVRAMGCALRAQPAQTWSEWSVPSLEIGLLEPPLTGDQCDKYEPAVTIDGRYHLWMAGEAYYGGGLIDVPTPDATRTATFRRTLLEALLARGVDGIVELDGEYQIVLWDAAQRTLMILNDRFGGLPLYWARSRQGVAFAGGVRGILMAPGVAADPDPEAIVEAVTFGGFRLGDRTNVRAVKMVPGGSIMSVRNGVPMFRRYWRWADIRSIPLRPMKDVIAQQHALWRTAVHRRLAGSRRPGQTLSGGLDSRAILAEAAPSVPHWTAITYGVPGCDDARYAQQAAAVMGATWIFHPLYRGGRPDWLERRTQYVQMTDGLIDLTDLMHLETLPLQAHLIDVQLSGYVGDAVSGPTFNATTTAPEVLDALPFYETQLGLTAGAALVRAREMVAHLEGAAARYALFEHKLPQSTNRWTAAWRPWIRVRKPFVDYAFFDFCQGLPTDVRGRQALHEQWLHSRYPACFARIPNQKTGVPILTPRWRWHLARVARFGWRKIQSRLGAVGLPARERSRSYHADHIFWRRPEARQRIVATILRPESLSCEFLGRDRVTVVVTDWFERLAAPTQIVGALYVYEAYHRDLRNHLQAARTSAPDTCSAGLPSWSWSSHAQPDG